MKEKGSYTFNMKDTLYYNDVLHQYYSDSDMFMVNSQQIIILFQVT